MSKSDESNIHKSFHFENKQKYQKIYRCSTAADLLLLWSHKMTWRKNVCALEESSWKFTIHYEWKWSQQLSFVVSFPFLARGRTGPQATPLEMPLCALESDSHSGLLPSCSPPTPFISHTYRSFHHPPLSHIFPLCILPVMGLTDTRHQQVLWPRWIRFPTCQKIMLHVHIYGLVLHSWRFFIATLVCCQVR